MISHRQLFMQHQGQTSPAPLMLEIVSAEGIYMYDTQGKAYIDLISGVSVSNLGHRHKAVIEAIKLQLDKYMHLHVYGEIVQAPQVLFAKKLTSILPEKLNCVYFVNSGSEAIEGAIKLAKRFTGRSEIISFRNAYHGSTHGALSIMGSEMFKTAFRPLLPDVRLLNFNLNSDLEQITQRTAAVVVEAIQGEAGIIPANFDFLEKLQARCSETGTLLVFDEIQTGFGRTGKMFAFEHYSVVPDIFAIAKAMGAGLPLGAFVARKEIMNSLTHKPVLGHITTFGGNAVCAAAALAQLNFLIESNLISEVEAKAELFVKLLKHKEIKSIRGKGLFLSVEMENSEKQMKFFNKAIENGIITDWFLFDDKRFRISPPLIINKEQIETACNLILKTLNEI